MTKKLSKWDKDANKTRRSVLLYVKKLLKDKSVQINFGIENMVGRSEYGTILFTGQHKVTLDWWAKVK